MQQAPDPVENPGPVESPLETDEHRHARVMRQLRELSEVTVELARLAAAHAKAELTAHRPGTAPAPSRWHAVFERYARTARTLMALEHRLARPQTPAAKPAKPADKPADAPLRLTAPDRIRTMIREPLVAAARAEPDRATRERLYKHIDARIEAERAENPDAKPIQILETIAAEMNITVPYKHLSDELLGMPPREYPDAPPGWKPPTDPRAGRRFG